MSLKLSNISKRFGDKWILRDASLEVASGEIFGLLGENASGKTILLKIISGTESPDQGSISLNSNDLTGTTEKERGFYFPQSESQSVWKSFFGSDKTSAASTGEKQQTDFQNSLNQAESVLLLDNPFCCLSENEREAALEHLKSVAKEKNLMVVFTTSDYEEAFAVCDRIGVLHGGEIVQTGTPRELYEKPINRAVAANLGRNNFINARRITFNNEQTQEFQTLEGDHRLLIGKIEKRMNLGAITSNVTLAIRPEHISISFGASFPEDNLLRASIVGVHYRGATTRVKLSANDLMLEALVLRLVGLNVGDECMVGLPPDRILVLKD